jgi:hypothetical protein
MKFIRYQLQHRKYASNVILGIHLVWNEDKKQFVEKAELILAPLQIKAEGDKLADELCEYLNITLISLDN